MSDRFIKNFITGIVAAVTALLCVLPMDLFPLWNGEKPGHRNQYELMAEAILEGRIDFAYGDEGNLAELNNPYDPEERQEAGVYYHWDHAYYKGKYYMYFGVVPVFLAFLPYRLLTGSALTTFRATQYFTVLAVVGIFVLFQFLHKKFFPKLSFGVRLALSAAFSVMSVWYAAAEPALYCTAITAAMSLQIWSLYFFIQAVWGNHSENTGLFLAGIGTLLGALVFGCRPPIALANILVLPMLYVYLKQRPFRWQMIGKLALAAAPYAVVAAALMLYNYARFEDPFQFGQAYQLTVADQSGYNFVLDRETLLRIFNNTGANLFERADIKLQFPYLQHGGVYYNYPVLLLTAGALTSTARKELKKHSLTALLASILAAIVIITALDIIWTPYLLERYRMDIYFLAGIACFMAVGAWLQGSSDRFRKGMEMALIAMSVCTVIASYYFFMRTVNVYYPDWVASIGTIFG